MANHFGMGGGLRVGLANAASWACALILWAFAGTEARAGYSYAEVNVTSLGSAAALEIAWDEFVGGSWNGVAGSGSFTTTGVKTLYSPGGTASAPLRLRAVYSGSTLGTYEFGTRSGSSDVFFTGTLSVSGLTPTFTGSATGSTAPGPTPGWKLRYCFLNLGTVPQQYTLGEWNPTTSKFDLSSDGFVTVQPGEQFCADAETGDTTKGKLGWIRKEADGRFTVLKTWDETYAGWEQTTGAPSVTSNFFDSGQTATTTGNTAGGTFGTGTTTQDQNSKDNPSIAFGTATGSASESSLKTGFASVRTAVGEGNAATVKGLAELGGKLDTANTQLDRIGDALTTTPPDTSASVVASGTAASLAIRNYYEDLATDFAGIGGTYTPPTPATTWPFVVGAGTVDLYPLGDAGTVEVVNFAKYLFAWSMAVTLVWWAWRETYNTWVFTTVVPQATAASNTPLLSSGSAGLMAAVISTSMVAIPMVFVTWLGVGAYPSMILTSPFDGLSDGAPTTSAGVWLARLLWLVDYIVPWATVISQIAIRFVYHMTLSGAYALSSTIIKFAVG
jgi:hypothetical protein